MTKVEMDALIQRNCQLALDFFHGRLVLKSPAPTFNSSKPDKDKLIYAWYSVLVGGFYNKSEYNYFKDQLDPYSAKHLAIAFQWVYDHFLELDLGGNFKWYAALIAILTHLGKRSDSTISHHFARKLRVEYLSDTRWSDEL